MSNVGDENAVLDREKQLELLKETEEQELLNLINTAGGRWFLWRLLQQCGLYSSTSHLDPQRMAIASGKRDVGLWVIEKINEVDATGYLKLVNEAKKREIDG